MKKRKRNHKLPTRPEKPGSISRAAGQILTTYHVGALPIINHFIKRAKIEDLLRQFVFEDKRCTISPATGVVLLLRNYLMSREPLYGVSEWAAECVPDLLDLSPEQVGSLNDDRVGRCLDRLFDADCPGLALSVARHVVKDFNVKLDEIHNDSTTVTFFGNYEGATEGKRIRGKRTPAVTLGKNKDHRPDLKQLLYKLTVSSDGAVPLIYGVDSGNVTDDKTHIETWDFLVELVGGPDFLYVADSKLATRENMTHIANRGGRFVSVLPRTRAEDKQFRRRVIAGEIEWHENYRKVADDGKVADIVSTTNEKFVTSEGFRLIWFHSTRKAELDIASRGKKVRRALESMQDLAKKLDSPRTRFREEEKVRRELEKRLFIRGASEWMTTHVERIEKKEYLQATPGRPGPDTKYTCEVKTRFRLHYSIDHEKLNDESKHDGVFPLVTNETTLVALEVLRAYKRQPHLEKRFSQFKTQFEVAPVFLKAIHRIVALLTAYFLALIIQALIERELRLAMKRERIESLPLYPEERQCRAPCARRVIDLFDNIQRHELRTSNKGESVTFITELSDLQREVLRLLGVPLDAYTK